MSLTKERCIELAEQWADIAARDRNGWGYKTAHASATIALTYATLASVVPSENDK